MCITKYMSGFHNRIQVNENRDTKPISAPPIPIRTTSKVEQYAAEIRRRLESKERTGTAEDYLTAPLLDCDLGHAPSEPLIGWIRFNQLRPTQESLYFTRVPTTDDGLLMFQQRDSSDLCRYVVFGLIEGDAIENIEATLLALFKANGHSSLPLFQDLPTSVFHRENWDCTDPPPAFGSGLARHLFKSLAASVWPTNMTKTCDLFRRYPDPWKRTLKENAIRESAMDGVVQERGTFDEVQFNEWFDLVTEPKHIEEERTIFRIDWKEAQVRFNEEQRVIVN